MPDYTKDPLATSMTLVRQAKEGDDDALNALFERYSARVLQIVRMRLGPGLRAKLESQDVCQEAFLRAVKGFGRFELRHEGAFLHWMGRLVENAIRDQHDYFSAQKRSAGGEVPLRTVETTHDDHAPELRGTDPTPSRFHRAQEDLERLLAAMDQLDEAGRDVIIHRDMEGLPFADIGGLMGRSEDAARMLYTRAKARLAVLMRED